VTQPLPPAAASDRAADSEPGVARYPQLFSAFRLRQLAFANGVMALAQGTRMVQDGLVMPGDIAHWAALAPSGVGLAIHSGMTVHAVALLRHRAASRI